MQWTLTRSPSRSTAFQTKTWMRPTATQCLPWSTKAARATGWRVHEAILVAISRTTTARTNGTTSPTWVRPGWANGSIGFTTLAIALRRTGSSSSGATASGLCSGIRPAPHTMTRKVHTLSWASTRGRGASARGRRWRTRRRTWSSTEGSSRAIERAATRRWTHPAARAASVDEMGLESSLDVLMCTATGLCRIRHPRHAQ
mmetsp:Transcript_56792/g.126830  ORF Transcript_56792/g.126830 Transcript_56792/m.126830 type:complete len:201 (-) Transcript_56792:58-660(-)